jgi:guanosine-3',5'-bis(diphosphate) 3'-pyrophosphohydrolase
MNHSNACQYSLRLINKLKFLDKENKLDYNLINKAIFWAKKYHNGQFRKSGEPFYSHPIEVAYMVSDFTLKTDIIVTSILHDIVEDTEVTAGMILDVFGRRIEEMVDLLTRDRTDGSKFTVQEILNNAYGKGDKEVLLIKCIDRLHNMQTIGAKAPEKIAKTVKETLNSFLTVTTYLGLLQIEQKIVDNCLDYTSKNNVLSDEELGFSFNECFSPLSLI